MSEFHKAFRKLIDEDYEGKPEKFRVKSGGSSGYVSETYNCLGKPRVPRLALWLKTAKVEHAIARELLRLLSHEWSKENDAALYAVDMAKQRIDHKRITAASARLIAILFAAFREHGYEIPEEAIHLAKILQIPL